MLAKLLTGGDLHKLHKDITTIKGYSDCTTEVQLKLMKELKRLQYTHFLGLGDWYHKGYSTDISAALADTNLDIAMCNQLNGNFFGVIGNHVRLHMDSNPELSLIQPHPYLKSRKKVHRLYQIIKTPDFLRIGNVQISFMHHKPIIENPLEYKPKRYDWATYHIALFHDPRVVPIKRIREANINGTVSFSNNLIGTIMQDVDFAICGDIHTPCGTFEVPTSGGKCIMCVPGSLTNTENSEDSMHHSVKLPTIEINDDSSVTISYLNFDLMTNYVDFINKKREITSSLSSELRSLRGSKTDKELLGDEDLTGYVSDKPTSSMNFDEFMARPQYTREDRELVRLVLEAPSDIKALLSVPKDASPFDL